MSRIILKITDATFMSVPFSRPNAFFISILKEDLNERSAYLPGNPSINLVAAEVRNYLKQELATIIIKKLYNKMWLVARKDGHNVDNLSKQRVKERKIILTNEIRLHLI